MWARARVVALADVMTLPATVLLPGGRIAPVARHRSMLALAGRLAGTDGQPHRSGAVLAAVTAGTLADPAAGPVLPRWLAVSAFLESLYQTLKFGGLVALPVLLSRAQTNALWERLIASELPPPARPRAQRLLPNLRRQLMSAGIDPAAMNWPPSQGDPMLRRLLLRFQTELEALDAIDADGLSVALPAWIRTTDPGPGLWPGAMVLVEPPSPALAGVLEVAAAEGVELCRVTPGTGGVPEYRVADEFRVELRAAARWAMRERDSLAGTLQPASVAIAVADLGNRREVVTSTLREVLGPEESETWGFVHPPPLDACPVVRDAMVCLEMMLPGLRADRLRALLRAVHHRDATSGGHALAALADAAWLIGNATVEAADAYRHLREAGASNMANACQKVARAATRVARQPLPAWAAQFAKTLDAFGWPGDETLLSDEDRLAVDALREQIGALAALDEILPPQGLDEALDRLRQALAGQAGVRASGPMPPIQVLDANDAILPLWPRLWVLGLAVGRWPSENVSVPGLPRTVATTLRAALDDSGAPARMRDAWLASEAVVLSYALHDGDEDQRPSAEIPALVAASRVDPGAAQGPTEPLAPFEWIDDDILTSAATLSTQPRGGSAVLDAQARCPFSAFARHQLGVFGAEEAALGLDPIKRGNFTHKVLDHLFGQLTDLATLKAAGPEQRLRLIEQSIDHAVEEMAMSCAEPLYVQMVEIERRSLIPRLLSWLELEAARTPFEVLERESRTPVEFGPLTLTLQFDRLDRLEDGRLAVIDYKTGSCRVADWLQERMVSVQLPLYAIAQSTPVAAIFFAQVKGEAPKLLGLFDPDLEPPHPGLKSAAGKIEDWEATLEQWRTVLIGYAREFAAGFARVSPQRESDCARCGMYALCRVRELPFVAEAEDEPAD